MSQHDQTQAHPGSDAADSGADERPREVKYTFSIELRTDLAAQEVERRALEAHRAGEVGARVAAYYLADLAGRGLFRQLGYASMEHYARTRMGVRRSTLSEYLRVGRSLAELPEIDRLFAKGLLNWTQVRALTRVAVPETEERWIAWAVERNGAEVEEQVRGRQRGSLPTDPSRRRIRTTRVAVNARLNAAQLAVWGLAREVLEREHFQCPVSDSDLLMWLARKVLREVPEVPLTRRPPRVDLDPRNYGEEVPMEERDEKTPPKLRAEVLERDGYSCTCCGGKDKLSAHHIHWRRYGGRTTAINLTSLCVTCHSLVHDRFLVLQGDAGTLCFLDSYGKELGSAGPLGEALPAPPASGSTAVDPSDPARSTAVDSSDPARSTAVDSATPRHVSFSDVPAEVDADWWRGHRHLFAWSERSGGLEFTPGRASSDGPGGEDREIEAPSGPGLAQLVGQERVRHSLRVAIDAARKEGTALGPVLFSGPPGLGKTSTAAAVAVELGGAFHSTPAPVVRDPALLVRLLSSLAAGSVLFVDEVHSLSSRTGEILYEAMEKGILDLPVRCGMAQRSLRIRLAPFTLIAATTEEDRLPEPLRARFVHRQRFSFYERAELNELVARAATARGLSLAPDALDLLSGASCDTPREALNLLWAVSDEARVADRTEVCAALVRAALDRTARAHDGLTAQQLDYLAALSRAGRPLGLSTLAARLSSSRRALQRVVEPYLIRRELLVVTPNGRSLTSAGRARVVACASPSSAP